MELKIIEVTKQFANKTAVNQLSFSLYNGVYGLLGANGAGKSTLMRMLCRLQRPSSGRILCNNKDIYTLGEQYASYLGYLPQTFGYYADFSARDFLLYLSLVKGLPKATATRRCNILLEQMGLAEVQDKKIKTFSGGMKQRVGIAQALLNNPQILILDEPSAGLDPKERVRLHNLISALAQNRIILLSTHIVSDVEDLANEILLIKNGQLLHKDTADSIAQCIRGQVWECRVDAEQVAHMTACFNVAKVKSTQSSVQLRIISKRQPCPEAVPVKPVLEDVYLYYFNERRTGNV